MCSWCGDPNIIHALVFPLCCIYILPTYLKWPPTSLWCRLAGWGHIVVVNFPRRLGAYLSFIALIFEVLSSSALIRTVGILSCYMFMFEEPWVHFHCDLIILWWRNYMCWKMKSSTSICSFNCWIIILIIVCGIQEYYKPHQLSYFKILNKLCHTLNHLPLNLMKIKELNRNALWK